jgi:hypothetical protein
MHYVLFFVAAMLFSTSHLSFADAEPWPDYCSGIWHSDQYGLKIGRGEGEGTCVIRKVVERELLETCTVGNYCEVVGFGKPCEESDDTNTAQRSQKYGCVEITSITAVRAKPIFLLPSQDTPNFYNARMCRDHQVLSALLTAAKSILKTKVTVAGSDGPTTEHDPDDIRLEAVSVLSDDKGAIFCSVTIVAKGITERVVYSVGPTGTPDSYGNSLVVKFGGDLGPHGGGHELFPEVIQVQPNETTQGR